MPDQYALGIDVSRYQPTIDWAAVAAGGISFVIIKATETTNYTDPTFRARWGEIKSAGMLRGAYHFFRPTVDPKRQASYFAQTVNWEPGDLPLVLDVESDGGLDKARLVKSIETCLQELERLLGMRPILYTAPNFWNTRVAYPSPPDWTPNYPLWIANYTSAAQPMIPKGWTAWTIWQYTDRGPVSGIPSGVDCNRFNGPVEALKQWVQGYAGGGAPAPTPEPPAPAPTPTPTPAPADVDLVGAYFKALNAGDLDALLALYQPNAALVTAAQTVSGAADIRAWFQDLLQNRLAGGTFTPGDSRQIGASRTFGWVCDGASGRLAEGQDTIGVLDGKINYHTTVFSQRS